ncbi:GGDEF domain-containing protein [Lactiplantibacillus songbeiensis]|uniref:GGDEF domain-containing protein n=1 Tax=Lactiplantibacillus songbeiensis TaxID=2559920 RepID=A0ABW4BZ64_9LACO|nr:GGDEF domain-containing protein [Lactiplantibacillus songbeiensis]
MTWTNWHVAPFTTSVFFVLGVLTLYWASVGWLKRWVHGHHWEITDRTIETWYGVLYMVVFTFSLQTLVIGQTYDWQFMNFQLIAIIFCGYFLSDRVAGIWLFPTVVIFMIYNHSMTSWLSWWHTVTLCLLFWGLNIAYRKWHTSRLAPVIYLTIIIPFGWLLWYWMKLKYQLSWKMLTLQWLYLVVFAILLYSYVIMLTHDSELKQRLKRFASHDSLTKAENYASYVDVGTCWFEKSKNTDQPLTMMMFDIDHFKQINDTHGHLAGDEVLQQVVTTVQTVLDENDPRIQLFRTGGEEFNLLFPDYHLAATQPIVAQIFNAVNHLRVVADGQPIEPTISVGVSELRAVDQELLDFYNRVDRNLYHSKRHGRMQITSA